MLNLNCLMINSAEPQVLADFYGKVLEKKPEMDGGPFIGFAAGSSFIMVGPHDKVHGKSQNPERQIFFLSTDEVEAEFNRIKDIPGATVIKEPYSPGGDAAVQLATLADPDGNYFQLATPWNG